MKEKRTSSHKIHKFSGFFCVSFWSQFSKIPLLGNLIKLVYAKSNPPTVHCKIALHNAENVTRSLRLSDFVGPSITQQCARALDLCNICCPKELHFTTRPTKLKVSTRCTAPANAAEIKML